MKINGVVNARHEGHAYKILQDLISEGILEYFELDGREDISFDEINSRYDAVVDSEGYLTMAEDYPTGLSDLLYKSRGTKTFSFEAEYYGG